MKSDRKIAHDADENNKQYPQLIFVCFFFPSARQYFYKLILIFFAFDGFTKPMYRIMHTSLRIHFLGEMQFSHVCFSALIRYLYARCTCSTLFDS